MPDGMLGVARLPRQLPRGDEGGHVDAQPPHRLPVLVEVVGVAQTVALDVRTTGVGGIGPPVVGLGEVVVKPTRAPRRRCGGHRHRLVPERGVRGRQYPLAIDRPDVEARRGRARRTRRDRDRGQELEHQCHISHATGTLGSRKRCACQRGRVALRPRGCGRRTLRKTLRPVPHPGRRRALSRPPARRSGEGPLAPRPRPGSTAPPRGTRAPPAP